MCHHLQDFRWLTCMGCAGPDRAVPPGKRLLRAVAVYTSWLGPVPDWSHTATSSCCVQILAELCSLAGAFQTVLTTIHQELVRSVYSTYYSAEAGTLQFSQVGAVLQAVPGTARLPVPKL